MVGTIGASISPYIRLVTANLAMFLMAAINVVMIVLTRTLSETKGKTIRTRIKEREDDDRPKSENEQRGSILS